MKTRAVPFLVAGLITITANLFTRPCRAERGPVEAAAAIIDDTASGWTSAGMSQIAGDQFHGGTAFAGGPPAEAVYTFMGTGVKVFGLSGKQIVVDRHRRAIGSAIVSLDGKPVKTISLSSPQTTYGTVIYEVSDLAEGNHVLSVKAADGWIAIDYLSVVDVPSSTPAAGAAADDGGKDYTISSPHAPGMYMAPRDGVAANGSLVAVYLPTTMAATMWHMTAVGNGLFKITLKKAPTLALTATDLHLAASPMGQPILAIYTGAGNQQWRLVSTPLGGYRVCPASRADLNLTLYNSGKSDGTVCDMFSDSHSDIQAWTFTPR